MWSWRSSGTYALASVASKSLENFEFYAIYTSAFEGISYYFIFCLHFSSREQENQPPDGKTFL